MAAKNTLVEKTMKPEAQMETDLTRGIPTKDLPLIEGQVITYPKSGAMHLFRTGEGPLLSAWQYGLGRSVAFTSDLSPRWGKSWVLWGHFGALVSQMVKWAQRKETSGNYHMEWKRKDGQTGFLVDVTDDRGNLINLLDLKTRILLPSGKNHLISLNQVAPGRYRGAFPSEEVGEYYLSLYSSSPDAGPSGPKIFGYGIPYTDEFQETGVNQELLSSLAALTRGRLLDVNTPPKGLFSTGGRAKEISPPLWPYLTLLAMLLLVVEVGIRKWYGMGYWKKKQGGV
jgi:hypothetical protein